MSKIDAMVAPRALTSSEIASVIAPQLIAYGLAHRAFTHAGIWDADEYANVHAAESVLHSTIADAESSMKQWLTDMQTDGTPRFYQAAGLKRAIEALCVVSGQVATTLSSPDDVVAFVELLIRRDRGTLESMITAAG